jgi:hypothetical protein
MVNNNNSNNHSNNNSTLSMCSNMLTGRVAWWPVCETSPSLNVLPRTQFKVINIDLPTIKCTATALT